MSTLTPTEPPRKARNPLSILMDQRTLLPCWCLRARLRQVAVPWLAGVPFAFLVMVVSYLVMVVLYLDLVSLLILLPLLL